MTDQSLIPIAQTAHKNYIRDCGEPLYWPTDHAKQAINDLILPAADCPFTPQWIYIRLPDWAHDLEVHGKGLLVDRSSLTKNDHGDWQDVDWWSAAFHYLNGTYERQMENSKGAPLHSYSYRLANTHLDLFEYAWVNRIFLFLRRWAAHEKGVDEHSIFPPLQRENIVLTHDIDYVSKTIPLILKKSLFDCLKFCKACASLQFFEAIKIITKSFKFATTPKKYNFFETMLQMEKRSGYTSIFHFYGGKKARNQSWLFDPSYAIQDVIQPIKKIQQMGGIIGLHPSYHCWDDADYFKIQKQSVEDISKKPVTHIRQHWLRFSWKTTWKEQAKAGLSLDTTLMWNDRPGFRNGTAMRFSPLNGNVKLPNFHALPTIIMDSHFFDYSVDSDDQQFQRLKHYLDEVRFVGGEAAIVWHHRVFDPETGWGPLYQRLLNEIEIHDNDTSR